MTKTPINAKGRRYVVGLKAGERLQETRKETFAV